MVGQTNNYVTYIDKIKNPAKPTEPFAIEKKEDKRLEVLYQAYTKISFYKTKKEQGYPNFRYCKNYYNKIYHVSTKGLLLIRDLSYFLL